MSSCIDPDRCGQPRNGRAPAGWIKVHVANQPDRGAWWCSLPCLIRGLQGARIQQGRPDVADCPLCINRHDRGHRCAVCNSAPQIVRLAPTPPRLYDHARRDITSSA